VNIDELRSQLSRTPTILPEGRVVSVTGLNIRVVLAGAKIGDLIRIERRGGEPVDAEIIGFDGGHAVAVPLGSLVGVGPDESVHTTGAPFEVRAGASLLGRIVDGLGRPLDGAPLPTGLRRVPVDSPPPPALSRRPISAAFVTRVRAIDGLLTLGAGQRVGLFAGSGVGKSMLLGAIARGAGADAVVVALVGERGREVNEFLDHALGPDGRRRSTVVVATSDAPALERLRAAHVATSLAEALRDEGANVLLLVDSATRFARAQREVGLAAGEPPARRGYPPSVFAALPRLLERAGTAANGSITAVYTVLVEGGDMDEPVADELRGILDGHIVLARSLASRGHYPAIDVVHSLSRVMPAVVSADHFKAADRARSLVAAYEEKRDLICLGGYVAGSDRQVDRAIAAKSAIDSFLQQDPNDLTDFEQTWAHLQQLVQVA
jgi:type III secretion protein N (ATPase)